MPVKSVEKRERNSPLPREALNLITARLEGNAALWTRSRVTQQKRCAPVGTQDRQQRELVHILVLFEQVVTPNYAG